MAREKSEGTDFEAKMSTQTANNNATSQSELFTRDFWKWTKDNQDLWVQFLAEIRAKSAMAQRQVQSKAQLAKELMTTLNRDNLASTLTILTDLSDLQGTVTDAYISQLDNVADTETISAERAMNDEYKKTSDKIIKDAMKALKSVSEKLDERNERESRRDRRRLSQDSQEDGQHHNDPPKVQIASDLRPEQLSETVNQLELDDWLERAECFAEASNIDKQSSTIQFGYFQALVHPSMMQTIKEYMESQMIIPADVDFQRGLEIAKESYFKKHDMYSLRLQTSADIFKGKTYSELQSWFFKFRQRAKNCGLLTMTEDEILCFRLVTAMTTSMQQTLFIQNPRPSLDEALTFMDNQVVVENMTRKQTNNKSSTVNNISETDKQSGLKCWVCAGPHKRDECRADKTTLKCDKCGLTGHATQACRGGPRERTRSPPPRSSRRSSSRRAPSSSSSRTSSSSSSRERRRRKEKEKRKSRDKKRKDKTNRRKSSASSAKYTSGSRTRSSSAAKQQKSTAGRTPKPNRKKRGVVNNVVDSENNCDVNVSDAQITMRGRRFVITSQKESKHKVLTTLDTGSKFNLADETEVTENGWSIEPLTEWEMPTLKNPDGSPLVLTGRVKLWVRLEGEKYKRSLTYLVTPKLESKFIIGLEDLKRLSWISPDWPADIEKWSKFFTTYNRDTEVVNAIREELTEDEEEEIEDRRKTEQEVDEDEECEEGMLDISDLMDLKTHLDIPGLQNFPQWLQDMIAEFPDVFTNQISSDSIMNVEPVTFSVRKDVKIPNKNITAHLPPANLRKSADELLEKLQKAKLIKQANRNCKYKSKAFFKAKKDGSARLLVDYKASQVNKLIERPVMPQHGVEQLISQVKPGMNYFISGDLVGAYFCYPLADGPEGADLTCFLTHKGKFTFQVLPMGCAASQDYLAETLTDMLDQPELKDDDDKGVVRLVDDIAGFTKDEKSMKKMAWTLFSRCRQYNVKLNPTKFQFSTKQINFGGMVISNTGVSPDPCRMDALAKYPTPKTCREVKMFMGCATSLASFTSVLLQDCKALRALTKKGAAFHWGEGEESEFRRIISRLTDPALLHHYDVSKPLAVDIDSSIQGVGWTAYMYDEARGLPGPGNAQLIKCGSAAAKPSWVNYSPIEIEASGVLLAVRKLDHYLINNKQVTVRNDHLPFVQAFNSKDISQVSPRLRRIFLELAELDIRLTWADSSQMQHVDALSRNPVDSADSLGPDPIDERMKEYQEAEVVNNINEVDNLDIQVNDPIYANLFFEASQSQGYQEAIRIMQTHEPVLWKDVPNGAYMRQLRDVWPNLHIVENNKGEKMFVVGGDKFVVAPGAIQGVLEAVDVTHMGYPKAIGYARARYFWPKMSSSIEAHCNSCLTCVQYSQAKPQEEVMPPTDEQIPSQPFEVIFCDEFEFRHKHYLMIVDSLSGYSRAYHLPGRRTANQLIKHIMQWQLDTGFARILGTDGAKVWTGEEFQDFLTQNKITHRLSAPMRASSNGKVEERCKSYKNMLNKLHHEGRTSEADARETWELLQNMPSRPGELSPARIAFRRERRHPLMPCIPAEGGDEAERGRQQFDKKLSDQVKKNSRKSKNVKKNDKFIVGQRVLTQKYSTNNKEKAFTVPAKVIAIRPNSHDRSAILELNNGTTTIRDRANCVIDISQPQPEPINNVTSSQTKYIKFIMKQQDMDNSSDQAIDNLLQKARARGASKVHFLADLGHSIMVEIHTEHLPPSCLRIPGKTPKSRRKLRFNIQEEDEDIEDNVEVTENRGDEDKPAEKNTSSSLLNH